MGKDTYIGPLFPPFLPEKRNLKALNPTGRWLISHFPVFFFFWPQNKSTHQTLREMSNVPSLISPPPP